MPINYDLRTVTEPWTIELIHYCSGVLSATICNRSFTQGIHCYRLLISALIFAEITLRPSIEINAGLKDYKSHDWRGDTVKVSEMTRRNWSCSWNPPSCGKLIWYLLTRAHNVLFWLISNLTQTPEVTYFLQQSFNSSSKLRWTKTFFLILTAPTVDVE